MRASHLNWALAGMKPNYQVHEDMYVEARQAGWEGWGGNERMSKAVLVDRFLELCKRPKQGKLLELGCGEGHHCRAFFRSWVLR
ncbi:hypothetical protein NI392_17350 [Vibrio alginolyticus]|uniref:hypothetical protein n=2 Tax=Vibrio alginolyticus TaxID=663 RepID=UPI000E00EACF|nr:hypothetical protein [Vibrio alginolyticus]WMN46982.1 hypothetical protein NI392_17350 [Vibrio alginolyticus]SUP19402.1 methyltransferase [Vibrio alginolyticus]